MSAYEEAWDTFRGYVTDVELDRLLKGVEREHAHELAEKIRAEVRQLKADEVLEPDKDWTAAGAADLIDPEVSDSGA